MPARYQVLQHEKKPYWLANCPLLMTSHALTKDTTNNTVFLQCKFENLSNKRIKALSIRVQCYDVTNQLLAAVDSFTYLDINIATAKSFGDQTPVPLPDRDTRAFHIIPQKIVFDDNSIWENADNQPFVLAEYEQKRISSLGDLTNQYKRDLHDICSKANAHAYLPTRKDGFTICGCGKIMLDSTKTCPACGVMIDRLFALNNADQLSTANKKYKLEQLKNEKIRIQQEQIAERERQKELSRRKTFFGRFATFGIPLFLTIVILIGMHIHQMHLYSAAADHIAAGYHYTAYINSDYQIEFIGKHNDIKHLNYYFGKLTDVKKIAASGDSTIVAIKKDGNIFFNSMYSKDVPSDYIIDSDYIVSKSDSKWNCIAAASQSRYIIGLSANGTALAYGYNEYGQCNVTQWTNLIQIASGYRHTVGLLSNGTCVATGANDRGQCNVESWDNIKMIAASSNHTIGLKNDGTIVFTGSNFNNKYDTADWTNIISISTNVAHIVGLRKDGTVVSTGENDYGQCNVENWTDIVAIKAGRCHTIGVKKDGTLVATGKNDDGQCNVDGIKLW